MALLHSTLIYINLPWLYFILLYSKLIYHGSTSFYFTLYLTLPCLYFTLLYSTSLYHGSTSLYFTLHYPTVALLHSILLCINYSTETLLHSILLYITLQWLYFTMGFSALILFQYRKGGTPTLLKVCIQKSTFFSIALFLPNSMLRSGASTGEINIII